MTDRKETYEVKGHPRVEIYLHAGDVRLKPGKEGFVSIVLSGNSEAVAAIEVDATDESISVRSTARKRRWFGGGSVDTTVSLPVGADVLVHLGAGDVTAAMDLREVEVHSGSGDIRLDDVSGPADLKVGSGDIRVGSLAGVTKVSSASGDCRIEKATEIAMSTAAGDLHLGEITESATIKSAAGDVRIRKFSGTDLGIKTMSGDASIGLVPGLTVNADIKTMSGDLRNRIKPSSGPKVGTMNLKVVSFVASSLVIIKALEKGKRVVTCASTGNAASLASSTPRLSIT